MSQRTAWQWPSLGFAILVSSYGLLAAFLAWGFATPELDRTWRVLQRLREADFVGLEPDEVETLSAALRRHPALSEALAERSPVGWIEPSLDGYTSSPVSHVLVRPTPGASLRIDVTCRGDSSAFPVTVELQGEGLDRTLRFDQPGQTDFLLPPGKPAVPTVATVRLTAARGASKPQLPVQISVGGQALGPGKPAS